MISSGDLNNPATWDKWKSKEDNFAKCKSTKSLLIYGTPAHNTPGVSIVIITYKRAAGLKEALESALNQNYSQPFEIVVSDDSGFDRETDDLMKQYCDKYSNILYYRHEKNIGQYANWNRACELSRTDWYGLLHDDDKLKPHYLEKCMSAVGTAPEEVGLLGSYMKMVGETNTGANAADRRSLLDRLVDLFIKLRKEKPIYLRLEDNIKYIYMLNSAFINKKRLIEIGGLNDEYFPSSDFVMAAKMNCYYSTIFLPIVLTEKGVGENESLKQSVCDDSVRAGFYLSYELAKEMGKKPNAQKRKASIAAVIAEIGVKGYNNVDYSGVKESLGMKKIYSKKPIINLINIYSKLNWGLLLIRRTSSRR